MASRHIVPGELVDFTSWLPFSDRAVLVILRLERNECDDDCMALRSGGEPGHVFYQNSWIVDPDKIPDHGPLAGSPQGHGFVSVMILNPLSVPPFQLDVGKFVQHTFQLFLKVPDGVFGDQIRIEFIDANASGSMLAIRRVASDGDAQRFASMSSRRIRSCASRNVSRLATRIP